MNIKDFEYIKNAYLAGHLTITDKQLSRNPYARAVYKNFINEYPQDQREAFLKVEQLLRDFWGDEFVDFRGITEQGDIKYNYLWKPDFTGTGQTPLEALKYGMPMGNYKISFYQSVIDTKGNVLKGE